jgi:hypothetical protein
MPIDPEFAALVAQIGAFRLTERRMQRAQSAMQAALRDGQAGERAIVEYLAAARHYFQEFEREARGHLRDVDRRLEHASQVQFNLSAERGVAVKRVEATQAVLQRLAQLEPQLP